MAVGGNFIVRKSALEAVGGFNCEIPFYGEDTDIAQRLSAVGRVLFRMGFTTILRRDGLSKKVPYLRAHDMQ